VPAGATPKPAKLPESEQNNQKSPPEVGTSGTLGTSKGSTLTRGDISFDAHACACDVKKTSRCANEPLEAPKVPDVPTCSAFDQTFYPKILALDLETYGVKRLSKIGKPLKGSPDALNPWKGDIRLVTLADDSGAILQCDLRSQQLPQHILNAISRGPLLIHHAAFDLSFLAVKLGVSIPDEVFCTLTASRLLEPSRQTKHRLSDVVERWLGVCLTKELGASDWGAETLSAEQIEYAGNDVRYLHPLKTALETALGNAGLTRVFELESQLIPIVAQIEQQGFAVDVAVLQQRCEEAEQEREALGATIRDKLNAPGLNPSSWQQLLVAFKAVGIELPDTDEQTLSTLSHEAAPLILEYRHVDKLRSSATTLLKHVQSDGRIHAKFNPLGARTGRFSSSKPNLQNVPRGLLRKCFVPSGPNRKLIVADYAQIELRIAALVANAVELQKMFRDRNFDMHHQTAEAILRKAPERLVSNGRQLAKAVNFGFLYGQGAKGFQRYALTGYGIALTLEEATEFRTLFFQQYPELRDWHANVWNQVQNGNVKTAKTLFGRLLLPDKDEEWQRFQMLTNYVVQGSGGDLIKAVIVKTAQILPSDAYLVATVHDELIFDCHEHDTLWLPGMIQLAMEDAFAEMFGGAIPGKAEVKICANWGDK
jgi:DNA polymerase I-like protein with 3'-5' exonuclease and polymerase domains